MKDLKLKKNKNFKALDITIFKKQIEFLKNNYNILAPDEVHYNIYNKKEFNKKDIWLTFDDGYKDHIKTVFPILEKNKLKASFYPTVIGSTGKDLLDINKIHLILNKNTNYNFLISYIKKQFYINNSNKEKNFEEILSSINSTSPYDSKKIILIKSLLQSALPLELRSKICNKLLIKLYKKNINKLSTNYYLNLEEIKQLFKAGHEIGLHGFNHYPLNSFSIGEKEKEIVKCFHFWNNKKLLKEKWSFCYPFGIHDIDCIKILKKIKCNVAITTHQSNLKLRTNLKRLALSRIDTNEVFKLLK